MNAPVTRRALLGATAAIGASVAGIPAAALAGSAPDPDAGLLDLIARHAELDADYARAEAEEERARKLAFAAYPPRPEALRRRPDDFPGTGLGAGLSDTDEDGERRWYGHRAVDWMRDRPAATWFPGRGGKLGSDDETRRLEIVSTFDNWWAACRAVDASSGWDAAAETAAEVGDELGAIEGEILATPPTTAAGLVAKARWASLPGLSEVTTAIWARQVVADLVAMAERGGAAS